MMGLAVHRTRLGRACGLALTSSFVQRLDMTMYSVFCILYSVFCILYSPWRKAPRTMHRMLSSQQQRKDIDGHGTPIIAPIVLYHSACVMVGLAGAPDETGARLRLGINK